jgi:hypothetical protein
MLPVTRRSRPSAVLGAAFGAYALPLLITASVAWAAIAAIRAQTGGEPAVPLDDAFIHFQYARSFVEGHPLSYSPGAEPAPGATSWLWPALLAVFHAAGLRDVSLIWAAWAIGFASLALLAVETRKLAEGLLSDESAICSGLMVLAFSAYTWFAASGMEVVPFAWLLTRTARCSADWVEVAPRFGLTSFEPREFALPSHLRLARWQLCALAWLTPLMRPEGAIASLLAALALLVAARGRRAWALLPLAGPLLGPALNWLFSGQTLNTTAVSKWLLMSPYQYGDRVRDLVLHNLSVLFETLLDGQVWSAIFVPSGGRVIAWCGLPALLFAGVLRRRMFRPFCVLVLALGVLIPTTYETFLWNRLRYLWPFAGAWFIGISALGDALGFAASRLRSELGGLRWLFGGICIGALASHFSRAIDDLAASADAVRRQQVALGRWARTALPKEAVLGINDTGAIAYFSGQRTFDIVGLTTQNEAKYWVAGAGSRFEHYEKLPRSALPSHFIVYPAWFAIPGLLGPQLTERSVSGATILGGERMVAYEADYRPLGASELPAAAPSTSLRDALDVADLESEASHGYQLYHASSVHNRVIQDDDSGRLDGGRDERTLEHFELDLEPGGTLVARLTAANTVRIKVSASGQVIGELVLSGKSWEEAALPIPGAVGAGPASIELSAPASHAFSALYYWSYAKSR